MNTIKCVNEWQHVKRGMWNGMEDAQSLYPKQWIPTLTLTPTLSLSRLKTRPTPTYSYLNWRTKTWYLYPKQRILKLRSHTKHCPYPDPKPQDSLLPKPLFLVVRITILNCSHPNSYPASTGPHLNPESMKIIANSPMQDVICNHSTRELFTSQNRKFHWSYCIPTLNSYPDIVYKVPKVPGTSDPHPPLIITMELVWNVLISTPKSQLCDHSHLMDMHTN